MDIAAVTFQVKPDELPLERLAGNSALSEAQKVGEVARQFESILVKKILTEARKGVLDEGLGESGSSLGIYQDMMNQVLADSISQSGMMGLAHSLQAELTREVSVAEGLLEDSEQ
ncbi:MAG: rod-binding protein [Limisphaerales bacterium]|jgi:Rod binding domain-containing protein